METRGKWTDLISGVGLEIADVFDQGQEEYRPGISNVLSVTQGAGAQRNFTGKTGAGRLSKFDDGDNMGEGSRHKTYNTTTVYNGYGEYLQITANTIVDHDYQEELGAMSDLSMAANFSQDEAGMQIFNGGFSTAEDVGGYTINWYGDDVPLYSTVHPTTVPGASTQSNASSSGIVFGHDNLETGQVAMIEQMTDDGKPISLLGKITLIVPPALRREGREETMSELNPDIDSGGKQQNAINVFSGAIDMVESNFLGAYTGNGSDTAWFLTIPSKNKLYHEVRQQPELNQEVDILSKTVTYTVDARWSNYVRDWRRNWGTKGDGVNYSG